MIGGEYHEKMIGASLWGNNILNGADGFSNMGEKKHEKNGAIPLDEYKTDRERLTEELTALKASEPRKTAPAVRLDKVFTSDFETVYKALNASERRRLWRSVIKEIRMDAGKNLDIIFL